MNKNQKDVIIEIIRLINQHLSLCFPQISRQKFLDTFNHIVIVDPQNENGKKKRTRIQNLKSHNQVIDNEASHKDVLLGKNSGSVNPF